MSIQLLSRMGFLIDQFLLNNMKSVIVTRDVLDIYEKYQCDFGLLDERWASKEDREKLTSEQKLIFGEFVDKLNWLKVENISKELRLSFEERIAELEKVIDPDVVKIIRERVMQSNNELY